MQKSERNKPLLPSLILPVYFVQILFSILNAKRKLNENMNEITKYFILNI